MTKQEKEAKLKKQAELDSLHRELLHTKGVIDCALSNFEQAVDPALVDCYIYEWKAAQLRYQFLLKCVKQYETT